MVVWPSKLSPLKFVLLPAEFKNGFTNMKILFFSDVLFFNNLQYDRSSEQSPA